MEATPPGPALGERFERALAETAAARRGDVGESGSPRVAHFLGVCALVLERGGTESEAIAALLHDTAGSPARGEYTVRIAQRFGHDVAEIVRHAGEDGEDVDVRRAAFYDATVARLWALGANTVARDSILLVRAAHLWYEANATLETYRAGGAVFERARGKKFGTLWSYRAFGDAALEHSGRHVPLARRLIAIVDELAGKPVTAQALLAAFAIDVQVERREKGSLLEAPARA